MTKKLPLSHDNETTVVNYCIKNNIDFLNVPVYATCMKAFEENPVIVEEKEDDGPARNINYNHKISRMIECNNDTVFRIAKRIKLEKRAQDEERWKANAIKALDYDKPDLNTLVENLSQLNIVGFDSYLSLICFLMQLKHSRLHNDDNSDKTCIFFNGIARNGKSATAKAICEVESEFGQVLQVNGAKAFQDPHEENLWRSHLNFCDEVKPTDIDRDLLLRIVSGGEWDVNPKNKEHYTVKMNGNQMFASNDTISLQQRRVSVVKFGNRLKGRPLGSDTLKNYIKNIMVSLPRWDVYNDIYQKVADFNIHRLNQLGYEAILTYLDKKMGFVNHADQTTLSFKIQFAPHDIYNCVKGTYNKQIISSERKDAITDALKDLVERKILNLVKYGSSTTIYYQINGKKYLEFQLWFNKINTTQEVLKPISKEELFRKLEPYFIENEEKRAYELSRMSKVVEEPEIKEINNTNTRLLDSAKCLAVEGVDHYGILDREKYEKGKALFQRLEGQIKLSLHDTVEEKIEKYITPEICEYVALDLIQTLFEQDRDVYGKLVDNPMVENRYVEFTGLSDARDRRVADDKKYNRYWKDLYDINRENPWHYINPDYIHVNCIYFPY